MTVLQNSLQNVQIVLLALVSYHFKIWSEQEANLFDDFGIVAQIEVGQFLKTVLLFGDLIRSLARSLVSKVAFEKHQTF